MGKDDSVERLSIRTNSRINDQLDQIMDVRELKYTSDAIREAIDFYHEFLAGGNGMGIAMILHLPPGVLHRADSLVGHTALDIENVLIQAMNLGLDRMLRDTSDTDRYAEKLRKTRTHLRSSKGDLFTVER